MGRARTPPDTREEVVDMATTVVVKGLWITNELLAIIAVGIGVIIWRRR